LERWWNGGGWLSIIARLVGFVALFGFTIGSFLAGIFFAGSALQELKLTPDNEMVRRQEAWEWCKRVYDAAKDMPEDMPAEER
jgi:hypothetical protein